MFAESLKKVLQIGFLICAFVCARVRAWHDNRMTTRYFTSRFGEYFDTGLVKDCCFEIGLAGHRQISAMDAPNIKYKAFMQ